jgi:hypothetical protein
VAKPTYNKPAAKPVQQKTFTKKVEQEPEGDLQLKLAALKNMFK